MLLNYFKVAFRNLLKNRGYSAINIGGLAIGLAVTILIGLWIWDELSFDKYHSHYDRIVRVMQNQTYNGKKNAHFSMPAVIGQEIRDKYGSDFKHVLQSSWNNSHTLSQGTKKLLKTGSFIEPGIIEMLGLELTAGDKRALDNTYSILLSSSVAEAFFGKENPVGKTLRFDNKFDLNVSGVYKDLPYNTSFRELTYIVPWELYYIDNPWIKQMTNPWGSNFTQVYAELAPSADIDKVNKRIINVKQDRVSAAEKRGKFEVFLHPMSKWHLYGEFKDGVNTGGNIQYVWLFGIVGLFVLLLACINFMNLSTARSEKRAREVGVRKAIGSERRQLIFQFYCESLAVVLLAALLSVLLVLLLLPPFNTLADKKIALPLGAPLFWLALLGTCLFTGLVAGSYPALYLSSFNPVQVLKGTLRTGRFAAIPRRVLVVLQFSVSVMLIIGTIIVYRQIEHARNRPIGYEKNGLVWVLSNKMLHEKFDALRNELQQAKVITEMAESGSPATEVWNTNGGFSWEGKDPNQSVDFPNNQVSYDFGKVIGWKIKEGRDFSRDYGTDTTAFILNETAAKFIGFKEPVGSILVWDSVPHRVIGVVEDMLVESPYQPVRAMLYHLSKEDESVLTFRLHPDKSTSESVHAIESALEKFDPSSAFEMRFVDESFKKKFGDEERIGKLANWFATLAVLISCLGLFGLASFVAEQRTKEIGVRKVLGASIPQLWKLLSQEFMVLVLIACAIAIPLAWWAMTRWLQNYDYRTRLDWWIFVTAMLGALLITLVTVSIQTIRAARANPIKSLRSE